MATGAKRSTFVGLSRRQIMGSSHSIVTTVSGQLAVRAERLLAVRIATWSSTISHRSELYYDVTMRVLDGGGRELAAPWFRAAMWSSARAKVPRLYLQKLEHRCPMTRPTRPRAVGARADRVVPGRAAPESPDPLHRFAGLEGYRIT